MFISQGHGRHSMFRGSWDRLAGRTVCGWSSSAAEHGLWWTSSCVLVQGCIVFVPGSSRTSTKFEHIFASHIPVLLIPLHFSSIGLFLFIIAC